MLRGICDAGVLRNANATANLEATFYNLALDVMLMRSIQ
jgi:hypothetical protein